jgi:hypothetical protein
MANVNDLKTPIEIWKSDPSTNTGGTPTQPLNLYRKTYAFMQVKSGGTETNELGRLPNTNVDFTIRYDPVVDYRVQIRYNTKFYEINHIEIIDREAWMKLQTQVFNELI